MFLSSDNVRRERSLGEVAVLGNATCLAIRADDERA